MNGCYYNDEIKVGEYIRSLVNGRIYKILEVSDLIEEPNVKYYKTGNLTGFCSTELYNVKHSFNIIDLIECGDYVNGKKIDAILDGGFKSEGVAERVLCFEIDFPIEKGLRAYHNHDIKSIVTKEQFKSIEYTIHEREEKENG